MGGVIAKSDLFKTTLGWILQEENNTAATSTLKNQSLFFKNNTYIPLYLSPIEVYICKENNINVNEKP